MTPPGTVNSFIKNSPGAQHELRTACLQLWSNMTSLEFITAIPWSVRRGSGCYVATRTLMEGIRRQGVRVSTTRPSFTRPAYTITRLLFNESLRWRAFDASATIGIDLDGYAVPRRRKSPPHIACIKGVLGDAVPFETGPTRASLAMQAWFEAKHARRADLVITISRYCAERLEDLYGIRKAVIVPELIDLRRWQNLLQANPASADPGRFTVFCVCRLYPRKRVEILVQAAAVLRREIPNLSIRIAGNGPEYRRLQRLSAELNVQRTVEWLGNVGLGRLAQEYNRADVFCLPSVQEGFGIVFLEAMAAGRPIVATRAAAIPEVVQDGILVEPDNPEALADAIVHLYRDPHLRDSLGAAGRQNVQKFDMPRVVARFLSEVSKVAPRLEIPERVGYAD
jgi:glycosyltransferase involved in cell wall biosynthesis